MNTLLRSGALALTLSTAFAPSSRAADDPAEKLRAALREAQARVDQLQSQNNQLSSQVNALQKDKTALQAQADDEKAHSEALRQQAEEANGKTRALEQSANGNAAALGAAQASDAALRKAIEQWKTGYQTVSEQAKQIDLERRRLAAQNAALEAKSKDADTGIATCREKNARLYSIGTDLVDRYQHKDLGDVIGEDEPFIQTTRVDMQNLMQDYQDKLYENRNDVGPPPADAGGAKKGGDEKAATTPPKS